MNYIVNFNLCTLSDEDLSNKVDALTDEMFESGKIPDRQVPARPDHDYDLLVGELVKRFRKQVENDQK